MENKTSSGYEKLEGSEYKITGNSSKTSPSYNHELPADDILLEDFPEEIFVLSEEYVRMEEEYVMWEGTTPCKAKNKGKDPGNDYEGQLMLPCEDSLQHLGELFTLKTMNKPASRP